MRAGLDSHQQRLRLGDLRHFRRRRKAFKRGREDSVGVGGAGGRLIELGERKRREQLVAARALLLRDGDGGLEGFLGGRRIGEVALQENFAAQAINERVRAMFSLFLSDRQRWSIVASALSAGHGFEVSKQPIERWYGVLVAQSEIGRQRLPKLNAPASGSVDGRAPNWKTSRQGHVSLMLCSSDS